MASDKYTTTWFCYGLGMTDAEAAAAFEKRFGYAAAKVQRDHTAIWCGPVRMQITIEPGHEPDGIMGIEQTSAIVNGEKDAIQAA
jgi:hypothetical protein